MQLTFMTISSLQLAIILQIITLEWQCIKYGQIISINNKYFHDKIMDLSSSHQINTLQCKQIMIKI